MNLSEAVAAIVEGHKVRNNMGTVIWLEHTAKGNPVLMSIPFGFDRPIRNVVLASEHFRETLTWEKV